MVISPDLDILQYKTLRGVKYFELVAEEVKQELLPGLFIKAWGYNGSTPGPTIIVNPGDNVNIRVYNNLKQATSVHWHGLDVPNLMDGVPYIEPSPKIEPGSYFDYHFKINNPPGTHMYHSHFLSCNQIMMGLMGGFIIQKPFDKIDKDFFLMLQEFKVENIPPYTVGEGVYSIDPSSHNFNFFTMNGKCFPNVTPLTVKYGEQVRVRFANAMMNSHPIHLHGHQFQITAADGNDLSTYNSMRKNTILISSGETWDIEFNAYNLGTWPLHCHIPHHMTNNMTEGNGGMLTTVHYE